MIFYEYDSQGWYIGWYDATSPRPNSTQLAPSMRPPLARFVGAAWTSDTTRETQQNTTEEADRTKRQQAIDIVKAYNPNTATASEVRVALGATIFLLKSLVQELR
jgi:hypothetical protein